MTNNTLASSQSGPLTGQVQRPRPIIAAVGAADGVAALEAARLVAERSGGAVAVLSVVEPPPVYSYGPEGALIPPGLMEIQLSDRLAAVHEQVARARGSAVSEPEWPVTVHYGDVGATIAREAAAMHAQLVVMGIGHHKPINRLFATETTLAAIRQVPCPVLAVAGEMRALPRIVVVATDFDAASSYAAESAMSLIAEDATVFLVHAWSRSGMTHPELREADEAHARSLPGRFEQFRSALKAPPSVTFEMVDLVGKPAREVLDFAHKQGAELIVAGMHGRGLIDRLVVGSVATALLRGASCSVLIAPEPSPGERERLVRRMTGTSSSRSPADWGSELEGFTRRNKGRRTRLEVSDRRLGAQVQERGYALLGAAYDPHGRRVELMLGDPASGAAHLTRGIGDVKTVAVLGGAAEQDQALSIENEDGQTLLTFL